MLKQYFSTDEKTGYIKYFQLITEDWIRLTPTIWGVIGYSLSQGKLYSQFRLDLTWNDYLPTTMFDEISTRLNYVFENENNNEYNYRIILNTLRLLFDDWWLTYSYTSQRPPAPLFKEDKEIYIDFIAEVDKNKDQKIDQYIEHNYKIIPSFDKNEKSMKNIIRSNVKFKCFFAFLKGIILSQYSKEMISYYDKNNGVLLKFKGKIFTTVFNELLIEYGFYTIYDKYVTPTDIFVGENNDIIQQCLDLSFGFSNEPEPDIFISSPSRGISE